MLRILVITLVLTVASIDADYDCVCIYAVEKKILPSPSTSATPDGYLYEFDCKSSVTVNGLNPQFKAIAYQHMIKYISVDANVQTQTCRGNPSSTDILTTTPQPPSTVIYQSSTSSSTTKTTTVSNALQTTTTTKVSTVPQSTSTVATSPQTTSTVITSPKTTTTKVKTMPSTTTLPQTTTTKASATPPTTTATRTTTFTSPQTTTTQSTTLTSTIKQTTSVITSTSTDKPVNTTGSSLAFIGIGYNLLTGNPSASSRAQGSHLVDPGFLLNRRILKLTSTGGGQGGVREVDVHTGSACNYTTTNQLVYDGKSYQSELMKLVLHDKVYANFVLAKDAFTRNQEFMKIRQNTEQGDRSVYFDVVKACTNGQARYKEEEVGMSHFAISREFATDVCRLPFVYNSTEYIQFLDNWGTNIVMSVKLGNIYLRRYRTTPLQVLLHSHRQRHDVFYPTGAFNGYSTSVTMNATEISSMNLAPFGTVMGVYKTGTPQPEPVQISLSPIAAALETQYWTEVLNRQMYTDVCDNLDTSVLNSIRENIHRALQEYSIQTSSSQPLTDVPLTIPLTWPFGTYGLMESSSGCPGDKVAWQRGHRKYDTEDTHSHTYFTTGIQKYMAGRFSSDDLTTNFCIKTYATTDNHYNRDWSPGTYCLLKKGNCPTGFQSGSIYWDDDDLGNHNSAGGILPDGEYSINTKIYYCCRNDVNPNQPILLPRDKPFILIRYKGSCQSVYDMQVEEVFIRWDDEDLFNKDSANGAHPFDDGGSKDHKLHFCYYRERQGGHKPAIIG